MKKDTWKHRKKNRKERFIGLICLGILLGGTVVPGLSVIAEEVVASQVTEEQMEAPNNESGAPLELLEKHDIPPVTETTAIEEVTQQEPDNTLIEEIAPVTEIPEDEVKVSEEELADDSNELEDLSREEKELVTEEKNKRDIAIGEEEIDHVVTEVITLRLYDLMSNKHNLFSKKSSDGQLTFTIGSNLNFSDGYSNALGRYAEGFTIHIDGETALTDQANGELFYFDDDIGGWYLSFSEDDQDSEQERTYYVKDSAGVITEYNLTFKTEKLSTSATIPVDFSVENHNQTKTSNDGILSVTTDYHERSLSLDTVGDWQFFTYDNFVADTRYQEKSYFSLVYSDTAQAVRMYETQVKRNISEVQDETISLSLSRKNTLAAGTEKHVATADGELNWRAYYDPSYDVYSVDGLDRWSETSLTYRAGDTDEEYVAYIELSMYDETSGNYTQRRVKLLVELDNTSAAEEEQNKAFFFDVDYNDLIMNTTTDTPLEVKLVYNNKRTESFYLGYDAVGLYETYWSKRSTKDEFISLYANQDENGENYYDFDNQLQEVGVGKVRATTSYGNEIIFTVNNMPSIGTLIEELDFPITRKNTYDNQAILEPVSLPGLKLTAYHEANTYFFDYPEYEYDGIYELDYSDEWTYSLADEESDLLQTILVRKVDSGRVVNEFRINYRLESIAYDLQEPLKMTLSKEDRYDFYLPKYQESADGLVVVGGGYIETTFEDETYGYFVREAKLTRKGEADGHMIVSNMDIIGTEELEPSQEQKYVYLVNDSQNIYRKYPVETIFDLKPAIKMSRNKLKV